MFTTIFPQILKGRRERRKVLKIFEKVWRLEVTVFFNNKGDTILKWGK